MDKKEIRHIVHGFYKKLKKRFNQISPGFDTEAIHQYRVEYKKLRAFLRLLSLQSKKDKINIPGKLKRIYRCTGELRDLQLLEQKLSLSSIPGDISRQTCLDNIRLDMQVMKEKFAETAQKKIITVARNKTYNDLPRRSTLPGFIKFAAKNWDSINTLISMHQFGDKQIHTVRKNLKDLSYNLKHFKGAEARILSLGNWNNSSIQYIETLMGALGNFQDNGKAVALLTRYIADARNAAFQLALKKVVKAWEMEKKHRKQFLVHQLKQAITV
jgi:CHAD domain-containing protein